MVTKRSNIRCRSDGFELTRWTGEVVRGAFIIDAHDREIISWRAVVTAGISRSHVRDLMLEAVERRFGPQRTPHPVEMPSDNGSCCIAQDTRIFARHLGLGSCLTPVKSPQSNGIAVAVLKTPKRDDLHVTPLPDAATALGLIAGWTGDDNDTHPHPGPRMRSPRQLTKAQSATANAQRQTGAGPLPS